MTNNPQPAGLYIHVPFCVQKCPYCDFYSVADPSLVPDYLQALKIEMRAAFRDDWNFDTLYIGGGTPSVLSPAQVAEILELAFQGFRMASDAEITMEVNPGTVNGSRLRAYRQAGIRRINIGVQSFQPKHLSFLGRIHSAAQARGVMQQARDAGYGNMGIDLIYGLPGQDANMWRRDLDTAVSGEPEHLSCYILSFESGTPLARALKDRRFNPLPDEVTAGLFKLTHTWLEKNGYEHYEISNFAKAASPLSGEKRDCFRSRHNQKYWSLAPYIGLGPSAHSFDGRRRWWNLADVREYIAGLHRLSRPPRDLETLSTRQHMMEAVYLGLRTREGIDLDEFETRFGTGFESLFAGVLPDLIAQGWVAFSGNRCALTLQGMLFLDAIAQRLVDEIGDEGD